MTRMKRIARATAVFGLALGAAGHLPRVAAAPDPLPSWTNDVTKRLIIGYVGRVTSASGKDFVPVADRVAVFDNDGTLWCEQPTYVEMAFAFARVPKVVATHPELRDRQPYKAVVDRDTQALAKLGE